MEQWNQTVSCTPTTDVVNKDNSNNVNSTTDNAKGDNAMTGMKVIYASNTPDWTNIIAALQATARAKMAGWDQPADEVLDGIAKAPYQGRTNLVFSKEAPTEGVYLENERVVMAYGPNPREGKFPYLLVVHVRPATGKEKPNLDQVMRGKLARYLAVPLEVLPDSMVEEIVEATSMRDKEFLKVKVNVFRDERKARTLQMGQETGRITFGGPGENVEGEPFFVHVENVNENGVIHVFRVFLPAMDEGDFGFQVKPFYFSTRPKPKAEDEGETEAE